MRAKSDFDCCSLYSCEPEYVYLVQSILMKGRSLLMFSVYLWCEPEAFFAVLAMSVSTTCNLYLFKGGVFLPCKFILLLAIVRCFAQFILVQARSHFGSDSCLCSSFFFFQA